MHATFVTLWLQVMQSLAHRDIRTRVLTNQRDRNYVYAVVSLTADSHFVGGPIVTYIFSRVSVGSAACVYGKGTVTSHLWLNIA